MTMPSRTITAPTGTSPRSEAARASTNATLMGSIRGLKALSIVLASPSLLCYQAPMTDSNDDGKKGRPRGRPGQGRTFGEKPFSKPSGGAPRPFRAKAEDGERPRREAGDRPFRARPSDERPRAPRDNANDSFS